MARWRWDCESRRPRRRTSRLRVQAEVLRAFGKDSSIGGSLLPTLRLGVRLRLVDDDAVVEVRHALGNVAHEARHARQLLVIDVLRLVRHLVIVAVSAGRKERDGNAIPSILVM